MPPRSPRSKAAPRRSPPAVKGASILAEAKVFKNGRSQAVRLPKAYRVDGDAVYVKRWRGAIILLPKENPWGPLIESLGAFSEDFMTEKATAPGQERPELNTLFD
jgi:antitoxin VapB